MLCPACQHHMTQTIGGYRCDRCPVPVVLPFESGVLPRIEKKVLTPKGVTK